MKIFDDLITGSQIKSKLNIVTSVLGLVFGKEKRILKKLFDYLVNYRRVIDNSYKQDDGIAPFPPYIGIGISDFCNLNCKMCPFVDSPFTRTMLPFDVLKMIVDETCADVLYINICGRGEPLLNPELFSMIEYVRKKNIVCSVGTNGTLLESKAQELIDAGVNVVNVSIDSIGEKHDEIRGVPGVFEKAMRGIQALKTRGSRCAPLLTVNCTVSSYGYEHIHELYERVKDLGVDIFSVAHLAYIRKPQVLKAQDCLFADIEIPKYDMSWDTVDAGYENIDVERLYDMTRNLMAKDEGVMVSMTPNIQNPDDMKTYYGFREFFVQKEIRCAWIAASVSSHGDLTMCDDYNMGNVITEGGFEKVWNNENFRTFRKKLKKHKRFPICLSCCRYY